MMIKKLQHLIVAGFIVVTASAGVVGLSVVSSTTVSAGACSGESSFLPKWYDGMCSSGQGGKQTIQSPADFAGGNDKTGIQTFIRNIAMNIVVILLTIVGYVSLGFIIWGGFKYMISGDNSSGISGAKTTILNAVIGLVLSIMSVSIVKLIGEAIK